MEFFLNPWYMVAGGAMISSPIIIHLINRLRYKRIRWAAMEFLLKSQKRNRRRIIIEQLILLLLRILLVLLAAFLVARFVGDALGLTPSASTAHVVVLDDTVSMADHWSENRITKNSLTLGKAQIVELAKKAAQANSAQYFKVIRLSNLEPVFEDRLNEESIRRLGVTLEGLKPTARHVDPAVGVEEARRQLTEGTRSDSRKWLHFVSDFRERDWGTGPNTDTLNKSIDNLTKMGVNVAYHDAANPDRAETRGVVVNHDNYAIVDLRPESRVAPTGLPMLFTVELENLGNDARDNLFLEVYIDGTLDFGSSRPIDAPKPGKRLRHNFQILFRDPGFATITCRLKDLDTQNGLLEDNTRSTVIEIRDKVPTLVIDGAGADGLRPGGDTLMIETALTAAKGYRVIQKPVEELKKPDLAKLYATIYLVNLGEIREEEARKNLKKYVEDGGNIVWFLGDNVRVSHYNTTLYKELKGLFPVLLADRPTDPIKDDEKVRRLGSPQPKIYIRDGKHPAMKGIFGEQDQMSSLIISRYHPAPRGAGEKDLNGPELLQELITLPNLNSLEIYKDGAKEIREDLAKVVADNPEALGAYKDRVEYWRKEIFSVLESAKADELYRLAGVLDQLLNDKGDRVVPKPGEKGEPKGVDFTLFWAAPEVRELRARIEQFRQQVQYGDPLAVTRKYGKGRILAFMTTAGRGWNDWSGGCPASYTFPMLMLDLQRYLTSGGDDGSRLVGDEIRFTLPSDEYEPEVAMFIQQTIQDQEKQGGAPAPEPAPGTPKARAGFQYLGKKVMNVNEGKYQFEFKDGIEPKVYYFEFTPRAKDGAARGPIEERCFAFNVDTEAESNLRRAAKEQLERNPAGSAVDKGKMLLFTPSDSLDILREKKADWSESPWLYLIFLLILVIEQAMAVHLSFHLRGSEQPSGTAAPTAPAAQPAVAA